ncbi:MAG TPA: hypothetical protein VIA18_33430, partial [Polyangia bacterium]|nr:hypothetical protein [Polyangia bacterium]
MRLRSLLPLAATTLMALALAGCGDDTTSNGGTGGNGSGGDMATPATVADMRTPADLAAANADLAPPKPGADMTPPPVGSDMTPPLVGDDMTPPPVGDDMTVAPDLAVPPTPVLVTTVDPGVAPIAVTINQGTAIGQGAGNGATPATLTYTRADTNNVETITSPTNPFQSTANVPDTAAGFCDYSGATPKRISYQTGNKFESAAGGDPMVPMAPFYFPLVYTSTLTPSDNAFGGKAPLIGLFDWRPKDIDEALVAAESDDNGVTWYFMQTVLELNPDYTNPISGGYSAAATNATTGCQSAITA